MRALIDMLQAHLVLALLRDAARNPVDLLQRLVAVLSAEPTPTLSTQSPVGLVQLLSMTIIPSLSASHLPTLHQKNLLLPIQKNLVIITTGH